MGILENFGKWLRAMRGGNQARSHIEAAKQRGDSDPHAAENKAKDEAAKGKVRPTGDGDITVGPR